MQKRLSWLSTHKFQAHLLVFFLIALPPISLYFTAHNKPLSLALLTAIILGNLLAVITP